jgi:dTDP-4-dehydrorhamnose 3,5-epimerase
MSRFEIGDTPLPGLKIVRRQRVGDSRGFLSRLFCADEMAAVFGVPIAQINHTFTARKGTVRGMHFQRPPHAEIKLVSCLRGEVWDVAVDVREGSPTFLRWHAERLSADNGQALLIPEGFAHGFQTLTDDVELLYCHSAAHAEHAEAGLDPKDPGLAVTWPLPFTELSARDAGHAGLTDAFRGVAI